MIGGVTRHILTHLSGVPHLHVNRLFERHAAHSHDGFSSIGPVLSELGFGRGEEGETGVTGK